MGDINKNDLDNYITGHWGEDQFDNEEAAWDGLHNQIDEQCADMSLSPAEATDIWKAGIEAYKVIMHLT